MSSLEKHIYEKDKIVVGGDLRSLLYAFSNAYPVIYVNPVKPLRFDMFEGVDLSDLGISSISPQPQVEVWSRLNFLLGLSGLLPLGPNAESMRVRDNQLSVITKHARNIKFNFNKLVVFDNEQISGLPQITSEKRGRNRVVDWVNVRSGCTHDFLHLQGDDDFVKEIIFYPTDRSDNRNLKDLAAISYLTDEQLADFDYSDTMVKFKVTKMMKEAGIRGARNGRDVNNPERYKYYAVKVEPAERQVFTDVVRTFKPDDRFEFCYDTLEDIVSNIKKPEHYLGKLSESF